MRSAWYRWVVAALLLSLASLGYAQSNSTEEGQAAGTAWLALMDAGNYGAAYDQAATMFRSHGSREGWVQNATELKNAYGGVKSRTLASAKYEHTLPGAPDGDYVVLTYNTAFANKAAGTESVVVMKDVDGKWHVVGYFVK